jgi:hypothetical protein
MVRIPLIYVSINGKVCVLYFDADTIDFLVVKLTEYEHHLSRFSDLYAPKGDRHQFRRTPSKVLTNETTLASLLESFDSPMCVVRTHLDTHDDDVMRILAHHRG